MASGLSTPFGITSLILVVVGIIMAIVGIILLIANQTNTKPWYIWVLLVGGVFIGIIGGVMLAIALREKPTISVE
jgi:uncharacterized membrane protein HdeD (DUF308 family)